MPFVSPALLQFLVARARESGAVVTVPRAGMGGNLYARCTGGAFADAAEKALGSGGIRSTPSSSTGLPNAVIEGDELRAAEFRRRIPKSQYPGRIGRRTARLRRWGSTSTGCARSYVGQSGARGKSRRAADLKNVCFGLFRTSLKAAEDRNRILQPGRRSLGSGWRAHNRRLSSCQQRP